MDAGNWKTAVDIAQVIAGFAAAITAGFAGWVIWSAARDRKNSHLLNHAKVSLERAYHALCGNTPDNGPPPHDRLRWLTAARLIIEYSSAKARITDELTLQECESHEEHWRHLFYVRLSAIQDGPPSYFSPRRESEAINKTSAVVIHHFATWPEGKADPLKMYTNHHEAIEKLRIHAKWHQLEIYCNTR